MHASLRFLFTSCSSGKENGPGVLRVLNGLRNSKNLGYIFTPSVQELPKFDVDYGSVIDDKTWRMI